MAKRSFRSRIRRFFQSRGAFSPARQFQREQRRASRKLRRDIGLPKGASDEWIKKQMSDATSGKTSALSESMVRSFWALTRDIWNRDDVKTGGRIDALMDYFGVDNMQDLMVRAFEEAGDRFFEETGRSLDIYRYSVNSFFGAGFFSTG